jgi:hypothetical protein
MEKIKEEVIKMIQTMPDDINLSDILDELYFKLQVDNGLKELDEGRWISHEEVELRLNDKCMRK